MRSVCAKAAYKMLMKSTPDGHGRPQGWARGVSCPPGPAKIVCFLTFLKENSMFFGHFLGK